MVRRIRVPIGYQFTRWSWFKIHLAGAIAPNGVVWLVRLLLRRLKLKIHIGSHTRTVWLRTDVTLSDLEEFMPLPVYEPLFPPEGPE